MFARALAFRDQFRRILIAQLVKAKIAPFGDRHALRQQRRRIQALKRAQGTQVPFAVGKQPLAGRIERAAVARGGQHILQPAAGAAVHVHITGGHRRQIAVGGQVQQHGRSRGIAGAAVQFNGEPGAIGENFAHPVPLGCGVAARRHPQGQAVLEAGGKIAALDLILTFAGAAARQGDQAAKLGVGTVIGREQHQLQIIRAGAKLRADDQFEALAGVEGAHRLVGAHGAGERALIGQRQRPVAKFMRPADQLGGCEAPRRKLKLLTQCSSAYSAMARRHLCPQALQVPLAAAQVAKYPLPRAFGRARQVIVTGDIGPIPPAAFDALRPCQQLRRRRDAARWRQQPAGSLGQQGGVACGRRLVHGSAAPGVFRPVIGIAAQLPHGIGT